MCVCVCSIVNTSACVWDCVHASCGLGDGDVDGYESAREEGERMRKGKGSIWVDTDE